MDIWADAFSVLDHQWFLISALFGVILSGLIITTSLLRKTTDNYYTDIEYFSLSVSGWLILVFLLAFLGHLSILIFDLVFTKIVITCFIFTCLLISSRNRKTTRLPAALFLFVIIILFFTAINMAFISRMTFPAYFDSAEHYRIIKYLLESPVKVNYYWPTPSYYHIGYHLVIAVISKLTDTSIVDEMLVSGQIAISILCASLFFIAKRETSSSIAAFFTILLAGFGWHMPTHAINWGKYPAIFGLICSVFVMNLIYLILKKDVDFLAARRLTSILLVGIVISGLIHTRSLVVCGLFTIAIVFTNRVELLQQRVRRLIFGVFLCILLTCGIYLRTELTFISLVTPYLENDSPILFFVFFLGIFSIWKFPKLTFTFLIFIGLIIGSLYIPLNGLLGYSNLFLLDRPYVQMLLFIPFSFIGGLGFAGVRHLLRASIITTLPVSTAVQLGILGFLAFNATFYQNYYPSNCCQLVGKDDAAAFSWIEETLPVNSKILIASSEISFTPDTLLLSVAGLDAGIWISTTTNKTTLLFSSNANLALSESYIQICDMQVDYIYVGNRPESFKEISLISRPEWYQGVFLLPSAKIYQVIGCS